LLVGCRPKANLLTVEFLPGERPLTVPARVVYHRRLARGGWVIGCQFVLPLTAAQVAVVLG
jgi:hypothetical protein